jgi:hypothetical protein
MSLERKYSKCMYVRTTRFKGMIEQESIPRCFDDTAAAVEGVSVEEKGCKIQQGEKEQGGRGRERPDCTLAAGHRDFVRMLEVDWSTDGNFHLGKSGAFTVK